MIYEPGTGSYEAEFLENIIDTTYKYGVPYIIDREKYEVVMKEFGKETSIKDANVVVFHADYNKDEEGDGDIYSYAFFAWPKNSPEGSEDFYDCFQFWDHDYDYKHKEEFEVFVYAILSCVVGVDKPHLLALIDEKNAERGKIACEIEVLKQLL